MLRQWVPNLTDDCSFISFHATFGVGDMVVVVTAVVLTVVYAQHQEHDAVMDRG